MTVNTTAWNRTRYGLLAPVYDAGMALLHLLGFGRARRRALSLLAPAPGTRLLIVGAGTGADLPFVPEGVDVVATDLSPAMVRRLERRARRLGRTVDARVVDGERLDFPDDHFDHVILHLVLAVMPEPEACAREVARVLRPAGTVSVFDKFVPDGDRPSRLRRALNVVADVAVTDLTRQLGPILEAGDLELLHGEPVVGGLFTVALAGHRVVPEGGPKAASGADDAGSPGDLLDGSTIRGHRPARPREWDRPGPEAEAE